MSDPLPSRDFTMLTIADAISKRSSCSRRGVGCVLTDEYGRIISIGHNGVPMRMPHCTDEPCQGANFRSGTGLTACLAVHAEENAIAFCPDIMKIDTCYTSVSPCEICIKLLLNTSCKRIVFFDEYLHPLSKDLWEKAEREWVHWAHPLEHQTYVYLHMKPNGDLFYVGKGCKKRAYRFNRRNQFYNNVVKKYGHRNIHIAIIPTRSDEEAFSLEKDLIKLLRNSYNLTNMTEGGDGFTSEYLKGKPAYTKGMKFPNRKKPYRVWNKGRKMTAEELEKFRAKKAPNWPLIKERLSKARKGKAMGKSPWNKGLFTSKRRRKKYDDTA